jgi:ribosomal protein S27AE
MGDGHLNKCKDCTKIDARNRRFDPKFREYVLAYDRKRGSRQDADAVRKYRDENPVKYKAHGMVARAVRSGRLVKPDACESCGAVVGLEGHHDDYAMPLDVRWLCSSCHKVWHAEHGEAVNG